MKGEPLKVLLVDDHELARRGLRRALEFMPEIEIVAEASNGEEALSYARRLSPDVILMDVKMPGVNGLEAARLLKEDGFSGKVIIISMYDQYVSEAIEAGVSGYLSKTAKIPEVVSAIRKVHAGGRAFGAGW